MKRISIFAVVFSMVVVCLLFGCQKEPGAAGSANGADPVSGAAAEPQAHISGLYSLQGFDGWVYGAGGDNGYYSISAAVQADGSTNIQYTDYETMQTVPLCAQVNCTHNTETCTSWLPYNGGGTSLMMVGDELLLVSPGQPVSYEALKEHSFPHIEVCEADGSERRKIVEFSANQQLKPPYLTDGKNLYCVLQTATEEEETLELMQVSLSERSCSTITLLDQSKAEKIWGAAGEYILLNALAIPGEEAIAQMDYSVQITRLNINTLEKELLLEYKIDECRAAVFDQTIVYYDQKTDRMVLIDSITKESQVIAEDFLQDEGSLYDLNLIFYDDSKLLTSTIVQDKSGRQQREFQILDAANKKLYNSELYYVANDRNLPIVPIAEIEKENSYFIIYNETVKQSQGVAEEGNGYYMVSSTPQYGKITKEDYWLGIKEIKAEQ